MRYHVTRQFTLNTQATRFGWSKFNEIALSDLGPNIGDQAIAQNYKNSWAFSVGFDYDVTPQTDGARRRRARPDAGAGRLPRSASPRGMATAGTMRPA